MNRQMATPGATPLDPRNGGQSHPARGQQGPLSGANRGGWGKRDVWRDDQHDQRPDRGQPTDRSPS